MNRSIGIASVLAVISCSLAASASAEDLSAEAALQRAWQHNSDLKSAANDLERADLLVVSEDGTRTPLWTTDAGYRYGQSPRLSAGGTRLTTTDALTVMTQLGYTFSPGTQIATWFEIGRTVRDTVELGDLGGAVDTTIGIEISQPWLRGFGVNVVDAALRQAMAQKRAAAAGEIATANTVAAQVLTAYWSLWSAQQSLNIAEESVTVTRQQLDAAQVRLDAGVVAPAELVSLRTELAAAQGSVVDARASLARASLEPARVMGVEASTMMRASDPQPPQVQLGSLEDSVELARQQSPDLVRLRANVQAAQVQARVARNAALPALDTTASVQAAGLGTGVGAAFEDLSGFDAVTGFIGLRLELPLSNSARRADAERAELSVESARIEVARSELELTARLSTLWADANAALERLELARQTAALARENVDAQSARFDAGKNTALEVTDAIQRLREADARIVEIQIELVNAQLGIREVSGALWSAG